MTLTARDLDILRLLRRYWYLRTGQIRDRVAPRDRDGAVTRGRMRKLEAAGYVHRHQPKLIDPLRPETAAPMWILTFKGANALVAATGDCSLLILNEADFKAWMSLGHYCSLSSIAMRIDDAVAAQSYVKLTALYFEHEVVCPEATEPSKKFRLNTVVNTMPRQVSCPDVALETDVQGYRRALLLEYETGADGSPARVAAIKAPGVAGLARGNQFRNYLPQSRDFRCLMLCPSQSWRDLARAEMKTKPGADLWLFAATAELTAESFLHGPIVYTVDRGPFPLIPAPAGSPGQASRGGEGRGEAAGGSIHA